MICISLHSYVVGKGGFYTRFALGELLNQKHNADRLCPLGSIHWGIRCRQGGEGEEIGDRRSRTHAMGETLLTLPIWKISDSELSRPVKQEGWNEK